MNGYGKTQSKAGNTGAAGRSYGAGRRPHGTAFLPMHLLDLHRRPRLLASALALATALGAQLPIHAQSLPAPMPGVASTPALPALGDAGLMNVAQERRLGDTIARELYRDPDYIDDPVLDSFVSEIWQRLLRSAQARGDLTDELHSRYAWRVLLGRDSSINAFALPGGYFGLHLGLVGHIDTRDELAAVLAHELTHSTQRHIPRMLEQQARQAPWLIASMVLGALAASKDPQAGQAIMAGGQALAARQQLSYSREMEHEADRIGHGVLTQAGYDPQGFVRLFGKLQQATRLMDDGNWPYLRSHPLTTQRMADLQQRQPNLGTASAAPAGTDWAAVLMAARARVLSRPGVQTLQSWANLPEQPGFARQPLPQRAAALYAAALIQSQQRRWDSASQHASALAAAVAEQPAALPLARLLQAEIALAAGQPAQALAWLPQAAKNESRASALLRAQAQLASGQAAPAISGLQTWLADHPQDARAWQTLAQAYAAQGQKLRALRAEGEASMAQMDYAGAVDRWRAAQDFSRQHPGNAADRIEANIIDTRLRAAQQALQQQRADERAR